MTPRQMQFVDLNTMGEHVLFHRHICSDWCNAKLYPPNTDFIKAPHIEDFIINRFTVLDYSNLGRGAPWQV